MFDTKNLRVGDKLKLIPKIYELREYILEGTLLKKKSNGLCLVQVENKIYKFDRYGRPRNNIYYLEGV